MPKPIPPIPPTPPSGPPYKKLLTYRYAKIIYDVEGASQGTSLKGYIKLVGVSRGSLEELLEDYKDFARRKKIEIWDQEGLRRFRRYRIFIQDGQPTPPFPPLPPQVEIWVNVMIDLITRTNYLLDQQRRSLEEKFINEGGYTETLFHKRLKRREGG